MEIRSYIVLAENRIHGRRNQTTTHFWLKTESMVVEITQQPIFFNNKWHYLCFSLRITYHVVVS